MGKGKYYIIDAVSNSMLGEYKRQLEGLPPLAATFSKALAFGSALHEFILEPEQFDRHDVTGSDIFLISKMAHAYRMATTEDERKGEKEKEYFFNRNGWKCKLKADIVSFSYITDLKTTAATTEPDFIQSVIDYEYYRQAAWYLDCPEVVQAGIHTFRLIAITKEKQPQVFKFEITRGSGLYQTGKAEYQQLLKKMAQDTSFDKYRVERLTA